MSRQPALPGFKKQRKPRRIMMHTEEFGQAPGMMPGWTTSKGGHFKCKKCGHDAGWLFNMNESEMRRGVPCPKCNRKGVA
ncbi:MAG: hypothetical protein CSA70_03760 [Rhodobacterales bacterium]|nr:MAG: hypothetical protein CSA70_03760 [Rhodobacterales bacterium]